MVSTTIFLLSLFAISAQAHIIMVYNLSSTEMYSFFFFHDDPSSLTVVFNLDDRETREFVFKLSNDTSAAGEIFNFEFLYGDGNPSGCLLKFDPVFEIYCGGRDFLASGTEKCHEVCSGMDLVRKIFLHTQCPLHCEKLKYGWRLHCKDRGKRKCDLILDSFRK
jgi:hypothetical protein